MIKATKAVGFRVGSEIATPSFCHFTKRNVNKPAHHASIEESYEHVPTIIIVVKNDAVFYTESVTAAISGGWFRRVYVNLSLWSLETTDRLTFDTKVAPNGHTRFGIKPIKERLSSYKAHILSVISNGHKEDVTVVQVKRYCEMESHEERLHKAALQRKIVENRKAMQLKALEIEKN
ncbi:coatomer subunit delta-like protein [Tanacetum coccineum]|uniref:Coatomer subunit delta n=1 Tax=Tanacetum coccineum TaxID=301880 RepID=A0ABQ4XM05_9ASTR